MKKHDMVTQLRFVANALESADEAPESSVAVWQAMGDQSWRTTMPEPKIDKRYIGGLPAGFIATAGRPDGNCVSGYGESPLLARENFVKKWGELVGVSGSVLGLIARCAKVVSDYARYHSDTYAYPPRFVEWSEQHVREVTTAMLDLAADLKPYLEN